MSSWPDDGALVMRWKKANEARRTKLSLMILHLESSKECYFLKTSLFNLFDHKVEIRRPTDIDKHTVTPWHASFRPKLAGFRL